MQDELQEDDDEELDDEEEALILDHDDEGEFPQLSLYWILIRCYRGCV